MNSIGILELAKAVERRLQFTSCMRIAGLGCNFDTFCIYFPGLVRLAHLFQRLSAMKIAGGIIRIVLKQRPELLHATLKIP